MYGVIVKTTVVIKDELADALRDFSLKTYKSRKKLSEALNFILSDFFSKKKEMFGSSEPFSISDVREKHDRFD